MLSHVLTSIESDTHAAHAAEPVSLRLVLVLGFGVATLSVTTTNLLPLRPIARLCGHRALPAAILKLRAPKPCRGAGSYGGRKTRSV